MRLARTVVVIALSVAALTCKRRDPGPLVSKPAFVRARGCEIRADLVPEPRTFSLGTEATLTVRLSTECDSVSLMIGGDAGNRLQRPNSYSVSAVDAEGNSVPSVDAENDQGGATGFTTFGRGKPYEQRLRLSDWLKLQRPGRYEVTAVKLFLFGTRDENEVANVTVASQIDVTR